MTDYYELWKEAQAEIERVKAAFMELCKGLEAQLGPGTPTEWVAKIERLRAALEDEK